MYKSESPANELTAILVRKEGRQAVLSLVDGQELIVPIHLLPRTTHEGETLYLRIFDEQQAKADKAELARSLLEEILNGE